MPSGSPARSSSVTSAFSRWTLNSGPSIPPPSYEEEPQVSPSQTVEEPTPSIESAPSIEAVQRPEVVDDPPRLPRAPSPVELTWTPEQGTIWNDSSGATAAGSSSEPIDNPPSYVVAQPPTVPVKYTFSPMGYNSMILLPPATSQDTRPRYHISVQLNCFNPLSSTTIVHRGSSENGDLIGEFQMGIGNNDPTLLIRNEEFKMDRVFSRTGSRRAGIWRWTFKNKYLVWDCESFPRCCRSQADVLYAKYTYSTELRKRNMPAKLSQLEVFPAGQAFFDDILLSLLIIERWRLLPAHGQLKALFGA